MKPRVSCEWSRRRTIAKQRQMFEASGCGLLRGLALFHAAEFLRGFLEGGDCAGRFIARGVFGNCAYGLVALP